ncbi:unnamed protein product [Somion occarium]|uniref:DNA polymerase lambda n=1 Tax=Somion occarium TaxID=3059160 RepID=A0ABP1CS29_9APHY
MSDITRFFAQLEERMNMPDEDVSDYLTRLSESHRNYDHTKTDNSSNDGAAWDSSLSHRIPGVDYCESNAAAEIQSSCGPVACDFSVVDRNVDTHSGASPSGAAINPNPDVIPRPSDARLKRKASDGRLASPGIRNKRAKASPENSRLTAANEIGDAQIPPSTQHDPVTRANQLPADSGNEPVQQGLHRYDTMHAPDTRPSVRRDNSAKEPTFFGANDCPAPEESAGVTAGQTHASEEPPQDVVQSRTSAHSSKRKRPSVQKSHASAVAAASSNAASLNDPTATSEPPSKRPRKTSNVKESASVWLSVKDPKQKQSLLPSEYAKKIEDKIKPAETFLSGMCIYYYGADLNIATQTTRMRMFKLAQYGARVAPKYDPESVTHIIVDKIVSRHIFLEKHNLRKLKDVPGHIPILTWDWVTDKGKGQFSKYAAFRRRNAVDSMPYDIDTNISSKAQRTAKGKKRASPRPPSSNSSDEEVSSIPQFTSSGRAKSKPNGPGRGDKGASDEKGANQSEVSPRTEEDAGIGSNKDPLAEFYELARSERDAERYRYRDDETDDENEHPGSRAVTGSGRISRQSKFICDGIKKSYANCPNQDVIDKLTALKRIHENGFAKDDRFKVYNYNKCLGQLHSYPTRIHSREEAMLLNGVGTETAKKIMEIIETGDLRRLHYERTGDIKIVETFRGIYGVGGKTAYKWYVNGCRTLDDLRNRKGGVKLSTVQQIGLKYYNVDINSRMPRSEAATIFDKIKAIALKIDPHLFIEIMGSYRRGKADCGDIDILITRPTDDGKTHAGVLCKLLRELRIAGIITEDLCLPDSWSDLELVYRGLCRKDSSSRRRRIDFLTVPYESRGAALLYYTGDDIFNRSMRMKANKMGYSLNQKGLFAGVVRDPHDRTRKLNQGTNIASSSERQIFEILGVPWQEPHERIRG